MSTIGESEPPPTPGFPCSPGISRTVEVAGCPIHYLEWGDPANPGLLLVPPSAGHAHWFDQVAPLLADQFHVVAVDPSGCGDSGRRETYSVDLIVDEIMGVCENAGMLAHSHRPTLIGHSAGAQFAMRAAIAHDDQLLGVIAIDGLRYARLATDSAVKALEGPRQAPPPPRVYGDLEEAVARFRLRPQPLRPVEAKAMIEHIARNSFRPVPGGWTSKFDPAQGSIIELALDQKDTLKDLACRSAALYAEYSHLADATAPAAIAEVSLGRTVSFILPGTTHYAPIDSPATFVGAIKGLVLAWIAEEHRAQ